MSVLRIESLRAGYGASTVLHDVDLTVDEGESVALVGRNGAGKSTLLLSVFRETNISSGAIWVHDRRIDRMPGYIAAKLGISISPQGRRILPNLTVKENLMLSRASGRKGRWDLSAVYELFPVLSERANRPGTMLSGGQQQMLAIGRALMSRPTLLLLDEPSLGLAPLVVRQIFGAIRELNRTTALTVLLVEQNAYQALRLAHRGYVLVNGAITMAGTGTELLARPEIRAAYLEGGHV
jgi:ABC-type branched-subunit amino acid transport system ATPase component